MNGDEVTNIACVAYNFFHNAQSHEPSFFLMYDRYVYIPTLVNVLQSTFRYLSDTPSMLVLEILREAYMMAAINYLKNDQDH